MSDRASREKEFHDERFADGVGARAQDKYYVAVSKARELLDVAIEKCARDGSVGLEVGCSTGENLERLLTRQVFTAHGIDISGAAVTVAQTRLSRFTPTPQLEVMDANQLRYGDSMFDFCFGSGVLHHLTLPDSVLELRRVLKPSGNFLFLEPLATNPVIQAYRRLTPGDRSADETPLTATHMAQIRRAFPHATFSYFGFFTIPCVLLNRWPALQRPTLAVAALLDKCLFAIPACWRFAWVVVIQGRQNKT